MKYKYTLAGENVVLEDQFIDCLLYTSRCVSETVQQMKMI